MSEPAFSFRVADSLDDCCPCLCFAICAAAAHHGITREEAHAIAKKADAGGDLTAQEIDFAELIELIVNAILQIIEACPQQNDDRLVKTLRRPGIRNRAMFARDVDGVCKRCASVRWRDSAGDIVKACETCCESLSDAELLNLVRDLRSPDYVLI